MDELEKHKVEVELTDSEATDFIKKCLEDGTSPKEVIEGFICDLIGSARGNGSDEEDLAKQYYERRGFPYIYNMNFPRWALKEGCFEEVRDLVEQIDENADELAALEESPENFEVLAGPELTIEQYKAIVGDETQRAYEELTAIYKQYAAETSNAEDLDKAIENILNYICVIQNFRKY